MPHPNPEELTSHLTKLHKTQQVIGYAQEGGSKCLTPTLKN